MSKKCPWCKVDVYLTELKHWWRCPECQTEFPERAFPKERTLFDRITASPEMLAPKFVYHVTSFLDGLDKPKKIWYSTIIQGRFFDTETEAKRATVAKLKEVGNG